MHEQNEHGLVIFRYISSAFSLASKRKQQKMPFSNHCFSTRHNIHKEVMIEEQSNLAYKEFMIKEPSKTIKKLQSVVPQTRSLSPPIVK